MRRRLRGGDRSARPGLRPDPRVAVAIGAGRWYAHPAMDTPPSRVTLPAGIVAALCGAVLGLLTFALAAGLWRAGQAPAARLTAESVLLSAMVVVSGVALLAQPARQRRARVPAGRALPRAWWPAPYDPLPALAVCLGAPLALGAGAALAVFR